MNNDAIKEVLLSEEELNDKVTELASAISEKYQDQNPLVISVLNGSFMFCADLLKKMNFPLELNFIQVSSYGNQTESSGEIQISGNRIDMKGRRVIIIEDIIDSGNTLKQLTEYFGTLGAESVETCVLLDKPSRREVDIKPDYVGFEIEDKFVVGYGLDYAQYYRNLPYIGVLDETQL
ncbi:MAG: hypoxanthine phosphoribosyltransferase [Eubacteriaceae bacterium]